jgi:S1-C subfamily serine protease
MRKRILALIAPAVLLAGADATQGQQTSKLLAEIAARTKNSMAMVRVVVKSELGEHTLGGPAVCINADKGEFLTLHLGSAFKPEQITKCELICPGPAGKTLKGELMGVDPGTGLGFVRAVEPHSWTELRFSPKANVSTGQQVFSVGLFQQDPAFTPCVGTAYVSARIRAPEHLVYVTGGRLTGVGSAVLDAEGKVIGLVGKQLLMNYRTQSRRGLVSFPLESRSDASFFVAVEEFVDVLTRIPQGGKVRRLPWIGVTTFLPLPEDIAEILDVTMPAVKVDRVIPGHPADRAGLRNGDYIVGLDGKPLEQLASPDLVSQNFVRIMARVPIGKPIRLRVLRGQQTMEFNVTPVAMPPTPREAPRYIDRRMGLLVREKVELDEYLIEGPAAKVEGLVVLSVERNSPAASAGLKSDDVITKASGQPVATVEAFQKVAERDLKALGQVILTVQRGGTELEVPVRPAAR